MSTVSPPISAATRSTVSAAELASYVHAASTHSAGNRLARASRRHCSTVSAGAATEERFWRYAPVQDVHLHRCEALVCAGVRCVHVRERSVLYAQRQ
jgi:hypothetical protein